MMTKCIKVYNKIHVTMLYSYNKDDKIMKPRCRLVLYVLGKATGIAKEHSINKISTVMIVGKFKIMRSGPKTVTVVYLFA